MSAPNDASSLTLRRKQRTLFADRTRKETAFRNGLQIFVDLEYNSVQRGAITYTPNYYNTTTGALVTTPAERDAYIASVPTRIPGAPTITNVVGGNASVTVYFTPSSQPVVSPVTGYRVISTPDGITASGSSSPITVTGLTNGTSYTFRVVAINANGSSAPSAASDPVTPATAPSAPVAIVVEAGNGTVTVLSITAPADDGGSAIQYYTVTTSDPYIGPFTVPYPFTEATTLFGFTNGTSYTLGVTAINGVGESSPTSSNAVTPATNPSAPIAVVVEGGDGIITVLSITAPVDDGGSAIQYYKVTPTPYFGTQFTILYPFTSPTSLLGFTNGTSYTLGVTAINGVGESSPTSSNAVTPENPIPPDNVYTSPTINSDVSIVTNVAKFSGGKSYRFANEGQQYLGIQGDNSWAFGTGDFTIEWFQYWSGTFSLFPRIFALNDTTIGCSIETGTFYVWINGAAISFGSVQPIGAAWHHFAIVRSGTTLRVYKNGTQVSTDKTNSSDITNNTSTLYIGVQHPNYIDTGFAGFITNFRIVKGLAVYTGNFTVPTSTLTLSAPENPYGGSNTVAIPAGYTKLLLTGGPVAEIQFDPGNASSYPGSGGTIRSIGLSSDVSGTMTNVAYTASSFGGYLSFNGSSSSILFPSYDFGSTLTLIAWVRPSEKSNINTLFANAPANNYSPGIKLGWNYWNGNTKEMWYEGGNGSSGNSSISPAGTVAMGSWQHIAYVFDKNSPYIYFYKNGSLLTSSATPVSGIPMNRLWYIGNMFNAPNYYMKSDLGIFTIFANKTVTADDILQDYISTKARYGL